MKIITLVKNCSLWEGPLLEKFVGSCFPWVEHHSGGGETEMPLKPVVKMMMRSSSLQLRRAIHVTLVTCTRSQGDQWRKSIKTNTERARMTWSEMGLVPSNLVQHTILLS